MFKFFLGALAALVVALPLAAQAQDIPSYAAQQYSADQNIHGRIVSFDGGYNVSVRDERGYVDNVQLHDGTIINPTGLTLAPGMVVSILGYNAGGYFAANQIDTPYEFYSGSPYYSGHPWNYYGPSVSLGFFFGNAGWWHGGAYGGGYRYDRGVRVYNHVRVNEIYGRPAIERHGREIVAPREHGGYYGNGARPGFNGRAGANGGHPGAYPGARPASNGPGGYPGTHPAGPQGHPGQLQGRPIGQPGGIPQGRPVGQPGRQPQSRPVGQPGRVPQGLPGGQSGAHPQSHPAGQPGGRPQGHPGGQPGGHPQGHPGGHPDGHPGGHPGGEHRGR